MSKTARRRPKQERSRALVDAIFEGTRRMIRDSEAIIKVTTTGVAKKAGVSVGSLYQYFPDKNSLFAALIEKELLKQKEQFAQVVLHHQNDSVDDLVDAITNVACDLYLRQSQFSGKLFLESVRLGRVPAIAQSRRDIASLFANELKRRGDLRPKAELKFSLEILSHAIMGIFEAAILDPEQQLNAENVAPEMRRLVRAFLHQ